ncbi:MAG: glycosyl hydrolase [Armatimonadetes bacterium]|nr:glycosyl hydrolase [Armatimonadota bacterium]
MRVMKFLLPAIAISFSAVAIAQSAPQAYLNQLEWREIGPWRGGRSCAVSGVPGEPDHFYMGATGGGVWRTTDAGKTWSNVSDGFFKTGTVGSIAVSESNPKVVYVGMGESEIRGNITHGDGVYRSDDAGKTWRHLGLEKTEVIGKVRVHPTNPDIAWVAALGKVWGPSQDRGVYKTTDGGKTWKKTLFVSDKAGAIDLILKPGDPNTVFATTWEAWRTPYALNSGGPGSGYYVSTDGGETWKDASKSAGLPAKIWGKVCVTVSPVDTNRMYLMIESKEGGLYRSDDAGASWKLINDDANIRQRPWYFSRVFADPQDKETVYVVNVAYQKSTNGGERFQGRSAGHSDHHDLWIDPKDNKRMIFANDGGAAVTTDAGQSWSDEDMPTAQFYNVHTDNAFPYNLLAAQQDNSTVRIPSRTFSNGIGPDDWTSTAGGESGYVVAHPLDPDLVYGGNYGGSLSWRNHRTRLSRSIDAWPDNPMGDGVGARDYRFQWTFPIVFSPNDPETMYVGSQYVLRTRDRGSSFERISPDLTRNEKEKQGPSGGPITGDNTSVEYYSTVFTIAEAPREPGTIWAGSDDGLVHVTRDGGKSWANVTPKGMPSHVLVSLIEASPNAAGAAYVAATNYKNGDYAPYIYRTENYGETWTKVVGGLPDNVFVRAVREDPAQRGMLYAGTENGIYVSYDNGDNWQSLSGKNFPVVPVHFLTVKDDDLCVATHGRGLWILDNLSVVRQGKGLDTNKPYLLTPRPASDLRFGPTGIGEVGKNPQSGLLINFWLPADADDVSVVMTDQAGTEIARGRATKGTKGLNTVGLSPRYPSWEGFPGLLMWGGYRGPIDAPPGDYRIMLKVGDFTSTTIAMWQKDPRSPASDADLVARWQLATKVAAKVTETNSYVIRIRALKERITESTKDDAALTNQGNALIARLKEVEDALHQSDAKASQDFLNYPIRLNNRLAGLLGNIESGPFGATRQCYQVFEQLSNLVDIEIQKFNLIISSDLTRLNDALKAKGREEIKVNDKG